MRARIALLATTAAFAALLATPPAHADGLCPDIPVPPTAAFTFTPDLPEAGQVVAFDGSSSLPGSLLTQFDAGLGLGFPLCTPGAPLPQLITGWRWDFGDGTPPVTEADPLIEHTYAAAGGYTAKLEVLTALLPASVTKPITVKEKPADPPPTTTTTTTPPPTTTTTPPTTTTTVKPTTTTTTTGSTKKKLKSNAYYCRAASRKRIKGQKQTPYSRCVSALKKLRAKRVKTAKRACKGTSKKRVPGKKRTPYAQCVVSANALLRDMKG